MKNMPDAYYVHRSAIGSLSKELFLKVMTLCPTDYEWNIVKVSKKQDMVTYIFSPDFDSSLEPYQKSYLCIKNGKAHRAHVDNGNNPFIYHRKEELVNKDYKGFDLKAARERTAVWRLFIVLADRSRIGRKKYWTKFCDKHKLRRDI